MGADTIGAMTREMETHTRESKARHDVVRVLNSAVLVLNGNFEPLNVTRVRRALLLLIRGKAEMIENGRGHLQAATTSLEVPSVIRLATYVRRPPPPQRLTRREVFTRDRNLCQYCGKPAKDLTLDHVVPRHRGGKNTWDNIVAACVRCNHRKAGRTPQEAGMNLLSVPALPRPNPYHPFYRFLGANESWRKFFPEPRRESRAQSSGDFDTP